MTFICGAAGKLQDEMQTVVLLANYCCCYVQSISKADAETANCSEKLYFLPENAIYINNRRTAVSNCKAGKKKRKKKRKFAIIFC